MPRSAVHLALLLSLALGACAGGQRRAGPRASPGASVRLAGAPSLELIGLRVAVAYEIRYMNTQPLAHPLPSELARLEPGTRELVVEAEVKTDPQGEPVKLRRAWAVQVPEGAPSSVTIVLGSGVAGKQPTLVLRAGPPQTGARSSAGARPGPARTPRLPACAALNPDLAACDEAADPPAKALCVVRAVRAQAKQKLNPGWMGCANHQGNRLRTARQLHGHAAARGDVAARDRLFARSSQLAAQARDCVRQYFLCD